MNTARAEFTFDGINATPSLTYQFGKIDNKDSSGIGADLNVTALFNEQIELGVGASYFESVLASGNKIPEQFNTSEIKKGLVPLYLVAKYNFNLADSQRLAIFLKLGSIEVDNGDLQIRHNDIINYQNAYKEKFEIETSMFVGAGIEYSIHNVTIGLDYKAFKLEQKYEMDYSRLSGMLDEETTTSKMVSYVGVSLGYKLNFSHKKEAK